VCGAGAALLSKAREPEDTGRLSGKIRQEYIQQQNLRQRPGRPFTRGGWAPRA